MLRNKRTRNILLAVVCVLVVVTTFSAISAWVGWIRASKPHVNSNLNGTFTRELHQDGSTTWSPYEPNRATIHGSTTAEGLGKAYIKLVSGKVGMVNGTGGTSVPSTKRAKTVGRWWQFILNPLIPRWKTGTEIINISKSGLVPTADNTYTWTATVEICISTVRFHSIGWHDEPEQCDEYNYQGSWTVKTEKVCPSCKKYVDSFTEHQITCPGCGSTYWSCSSNSRSPHRFQVCMPCIYGDRPGGVSYRCEGPHSCSGGSSNGGGTGSSNGGGTVGGGGGSDSYVACPAGSSCSKGGRVSRTDAHRVRLNSGCGHYFYDCIRGETDKHRLRTCSRCNRRYTRCGNWGPCRHNGRTYVYHN